MLHSVIIPHEKRERRLRLCLDRIAKATEYAAGRVEVVVVCESRLDYSGFNFGDYPFSELVINVGRRGKWFCKPRLQNIGIDSSLGEILTFLDCDSLVGERFFQGAEFCTSPRVSKVWYRVRALAEEALALAESDPTYIDRQFDVYDTHAQRFEAHQLPDLDLRFGVPATNIPSFGNSQFSIARNKLGDLRADEEYEGAGFEDIAFNLAIWKQFDECYHAVPMTDADHAILDIQNTREEDWFSPEQHVKNGERYRTQCPWNVLTPD